MGVDLGAYPEDQHITADNLAFFGEPVYEYDMSQGIQDGYLAACEIIRRDIFLDNKPDNERITGLDQADLQGKVIRNGITGQTYQVNEIQAHYEAANFEDEILLPDRVQAMCADLFNLLLASGGPEQKTIIFCTRDSHADRVAVEMNNLYAAWCRNLGRKPAAFYSFKCTAASSGNDYLADLRGASRHHFIAATVDLLSTGVDVPIVQNIVFFKYVRSPIAFYQMVGRGTRIYPPTGKLMFRVYDYTDATRLFGEAFLTRAPVYSDVKDSLPADLDQPAPDEASSLQVEGFTIQVTPAGRCILTMVDGKAMPVSVEEYKQRLAERLVAEAPTLDDFRLCWVQPQQRQALIASLPDGGRAPALVRALENMNDYDLYDVMAELGYGMAPRTRQERAAAFAYKHAQWLASLPYATSSTLYALTNQFARAGTEALENPLVFLTPSVKNAGGIVALQGIGNPSVILVKTKEKLFAV